MKKPDRIKSFEELLKEKSEGFELRPSDDSWANIKIALNEARRQRKLMWWGVAAVALLLGAGILGFMFTQQSQKAVITDNSEIKLPVSGESLNIPSEKSENLSPTKSEAIDQHDSEITDAGQYVEKSSRSLTSISTNKQDVNDNGNQLSTVTGDQNKHDLKRGIAVKQDAGVFAEMAGNKLPVKSGLLNSSVASNEMADKKNKSGQSLISRIKKDQENEKVNSDCGYRMSVQAEVIPLLSFPSKIYSGGSSIFSYSAGLNFSYRLSHKFFLGMGIHFTRTGESTGDAPVESTKGGATSDTLAATFVGTNYSSAYSIPTLLYNGTILEDWTDVDVRGEWMVFTGRKSDLSVIGGIGISHLVQDKFKANGSALTASTYLYIPNTSLLLKSNNLTCLGGLEYHRSLSCRWSLNGGVQIHYYLTNIHDASAQISEHPLWLGCNAGVEFKF